MRLLESWTANETRMYSIGQSTASNARHQPFLFWSILHLSPSYIGKTNEFYPLLWSPTSPALPASEELVSFSCVPSSSPHRLICSCSSRSSRTTSSNRCFSASSTWFRRSNSCTKRRGRRALHTTSSLPAPPQGSWMELACEEHPPLSAPSADTTLLFLPSVYLQTYARIEAKLQTNAISIPGMFMCEKYWLLGTCICITYCSVLIFLRLQRLRWH